MEKRNIIDSEEKCNMKIIDTSIPKAQSSKWVKTWLFVIVILLMFVSGCKTEVIEVTRPPTGASPPSPSTAEPDDSEYKKWPLIFSDNFNSNANQWYTGDENYTNQLGYFEVSGGVYSWYIESLEEYSGYYQIANMEPVADFYMSVDAAYISGVEVTGYGIVYRIDSDWNRYVFAVSPESKVFRVEHVNDPEGQWTTLIDWTESSVIDSNDPNRLAVLAQGSFFQFYVNDELVAELEDDRIPSGIVGLMAEVYETGDKVTINFDNLEVSAP